jgi:hypothetical protein
MRVPNISSTIAFYSREWVENEFHVLVSVWKTVVILTKGSVTPIPTDSNLLEIIVRYNKDIVNTMRVQIDGELLQYAIRNDIGILGHNEYTRFVVDKNNYLELFPVPDDLGPLTIHTRTNLIGYIKGDGYNLYTTPTDDENIDGGSASSVYLSNQKINGGNA